ncbi:TetR/AcrR family transcriptional regulator [uncultured Ellagibacter sp.]|uniref:TetR/AcrR family transcriptional regulator n=1 Tax=uncultured Ellagibacter sp. TaxID=2137580 RepID=UPI00261976BD|nr:TetR/AcrR family transcriptional regulator [uncultured Ellagibacter sp.]
MDLRVVKTKRAIKGALTDLCASKPLAEVTVKELCSRAEVSKPAFYYHYGNVADVVDEIEDDAVSAIVEKTLDGSVDLASEETLRRFGEHVFHSPLAPLLKPDASNGTFGRKLALALGKSHEAPHGRTRKDPDNLAVLFAFDGLMGCMGRLGYESYMRAVPELSKLMEDVLKD